MTFVHSLTQMLVFLSLYVMLSILLSILVCAAASLFCACLVSVQVSAACVIAGSMQEFMTRHTKTNHFSKNLLSLLTSIYLHSLFCKKSKALFVIQFSKLALPIANFANDATNFSLANFF